MSGFFSRANPFYPRTFAAVALAILLIPFEENGGFQYYAAAWLGLLPWALHALNLHLPFGMINRHGGPSHPGDTGGASFGGGCDGGGGGE